ncbi:ABC transporter ATP-binding protein [Sphingomonas zeae]
MIRVQGLSKRYYVHQRSDGIGAAVRSLFRRPTTEVTALHDVGFRLADGECVAFLGPNGAGKTTLLKILAGLLQPDAGLVEVDGFVPHRRDKAFLSRVALVMGNKSQLIWDLPPVDTFEMMRAIYRIDRPRYNATLARLTDLLDLNVVMRKPTRQLSLGERMRCEIAATLIHEPRILFLDEPTIGLDVTMQAALRDFIADYHRCQGATVLLTSHYMQDVVSLAPRVVVVNHGRLVYDGELRTFAQTAAPEKIVSFAWDGDRPPPDLGRFGQMQQLDGTRLGIRVPSAVVPDLVRQLVNTSMALDLTIENPPIEQVLRDFFAASKASAA